MAPERYERTVHMSVKVGRQGLERLNGDALPALREGAIGTLIVSADAIMNDEARQSLLRREEHDLVPTDSIVMLGVSTKMMGKDTGGLHQHLTRPAGLLGQVHWRFVAVQLKSPLRVRVEGEKSHQLLPCGCWIECLNEMAISLNHAFTLISTRFETKRKSHTGNMFTRAFAKSGNAWVSLEDLYMRIQ